MTNATLVKELGYDVRTELFEMSKKSAANQTLELIRPVSESLAKELDDSLEEIKDRKNLISSKKFWSRLNIKYGV